MEIILIGVALFLAFGNGANDNFKGFATVWGSEVLTYRRALALATLATLIGSLASLALAQSLVGQFTGRGLVPDAVAATQAFMLHAGIGAALTVFAATRAGLPVSTTHALIGGLLGAGLGHAGAEVRLERLASLFLLPLLVSPLIAAALGLLASRTLRLRVDDCACIVAADAQAQVEASGTGAALHAAVPPAPTFLIAPAAQCNGKPGVVARLSLASLADRAHVFSAAAICFARGVNDTPKLAALLLAGQIMNAPTAVIAIAAIMAAGGLLYARRVAETMSKRVCRMDHGQGLTANLITAALVLFASKLGLPVSTTHVSVGSITGVGAAAGTLDWRTVRNILSAWVVTLPLAAALAWSATGLY